MTRQASSSLSPESARLVLLLRQLRERTGLSLAGLAEATTFSKSSWERYLNGRILPPRGAVKELCRLAGEPDGRCLALWEIARAEWGGRAKEATRAPSAGAGASAPAPAPAPARRPGPAAVVPEPEPEPEAGRGAPAGDPVAAPVPTQAPTAAGNTRVGHRRTAVVAVLASVCAALLGAVVLTLLLLPHRSGAERPVGTLPASGSGSGSGSGPFCREAACRGKDPLVMRCAADPDTLVEHRTAGGASVQIRYSETCGSSWARMWGARIGDRIEVRVDGPDGPVRDARVGNRREADTYVHTLMGVTPPGALVQGCFLPAGRGEKECFEARSVLRHPGMAAPVPGTP